MLQVANICSEFFCIALLLVLLTGIVEQKNSPENRALLRLIFINIGYILVRMLSHILSGRVFPFSVPMNYAVMLLLGVLDAVIGLSACAYVYVVSAGRPMKHWGFWLPAFAIWAIVLATPFTGWYFSIDAQNVVSEGSLKWLKELLSHGYFLIALFIAMHFWRNAPTLSRKKKAEIAQGFAFFPGVFFIVHLLFPSIELHCFGVTLAIVSVYVRLQKHNIAVTMQKLNVERESAVLYRNTMLATALQFTVVNLTKGRITEISVPRRPELNLQTMITQGMIPSDNYSDIVVLWKENILYRSEEEKDRMLSAESMIEQFNAGESQMSNLYTVATASGFKHCKQEITLARSKFSGDIIATITNYDVTEQSEREEGYVVQQRVIEALAYGVSSYWIIDWETETIMKHHIENPLIQPIADRVLALGEYSLAMENVYLNYIEEAQKEEAAWLFSIEHIRERLSEAKQYVVPIYLHVPEISLYSQISFTRIQINNRSAFIMSTRNITTMVENEFQLRHELSAALERAQEASRAKSGFLFNISHDIRTPMNAILGFNEIAMKHVGDNEQAADALRKARYAGEHMLNLINDILDMSRIESGKVTLREEVISVKEHISRFEDMFRITMEKKQLSFRIIDETYSTHIYGDYLRITQVIANLLSNAAKFTPAGGEVVYHGVEFDPGEEGYTAFRISIRDTGIGISEEFKERLFLPFERERSATSSGVQGTGLGLAIVKQLVDLMGGTLVCNSKLGEGTEFVLTFKARIAEQKSETDEAETFDASMLKGKRVLLVEDNELNREIAAEMLAELDITVLEADDGSKAVEMLKNWTGDAPDAILMDIQMPIMNGYDATVAIRALSSPLSSLPIIAMTANAFEEDKRKAIECGMNAHMGKPISMQGMTETLCAVLGGNKA